MAYIDMFMIHLTKLNFYLLDWHYVLVIRQNDLFHRSLGFQEFLIMTHKHIRNFRDPLNGPFSKLFTINPHRYEKYEFPYPFIKYKLTRSRDMATVSISLEPALQNAEPVLDSRQFT